MASREEVSTARRYVETWRKDATWHDTHPGSRHLDALYDALTDCERERDECRETLKYAEEKINEARSDRDSWLRVAERYAQELDQATNTLKDILEEMDIVEAKKIAKDALDTLEVE